MNAAAPTAPVAFEFPAAPAGYVPPTMPRKGAVLVVDGVRYTVDRRYCHGRIFDLTGPDGFNTMLEPTVVAGLACGRIVVEQRGAR